MLGHTARSLEGAQRREAAAEPPPAREARLRRWDSNPRSRAHEAREGRPLLYCAIWPAGVEPAVSGSRSRRVASLPYSQSVPPAGLEPATSGLRARRHPFRPRGLECEAPAAGLEPALSRVTTACLTDSTTPEQRKQQDSNLRGGEPPYAVARRCLSSAMSPDGRRGSRNPKAVEAHPFSRRGTAPVAVLPSDFGRRRTCNLPIKSRVLCRVELRSHDVAGRNRTCGAPRFKRALYRAELRPQEMSEAGVEPAASCL